MMVWQHLTNVHIRENHQGKTGRRNGKQFVVENFDVVAGSVYLSPFLRYRSTSQNMDGSTAPSGLSGG